MLVGGGGRGVWGQDGGLQWRVAWSVLCGLERGRYEMMLGVLHLPLASRNALSALDDGRLLKLAFDLAECLVSSGPPSSFHRLTTQILPNCSLTTFPAEDLGQSLLIDRRSRGHAGASL